MTVTNRKRALHAEEVSSAWSILPARSPRPSFPPFLTPFELRKLTLFPLASNQRTRRTDRVRRMFSRSHAFHSDQVCRPCVYCRRWCRSLSELFLQWQGVWQAQTRSRIQGRGEQGLLTPTRHMRLTPRYMKELHSYPIFSEDWGADE